MKKGREREFPPLNTALCLLSIPFREGFMGPTPTPEITTKFYGLILQSVF